MTRVRQQPIGPASRAPQCFGRVLPCGNVSPEPRHEIPVAHSLRLAVDRGGRRHDRAQGLAYQLTGSVGLLSDALESFVNLAGALMALRC